MRGCLVLIIIFGINICLLVVCNGGMRVILIIEFLVIVNIFVIGSMFFYIYIVRDNIRKIVEDIVVVEKSDVCLVLVEYCDYFL